MIDAEPGGVAASARTGWVVGGLTRTPPIWIALATALGEVALALALVKGLAGPAPVLAGHLALCLLLGLRAAQDADASASLAHLTLWTFVAGPLGSLVALGLAILDGVAGKPALARDFGSWVEAEGALEPTTACRRLSSDLRDGRLRVGNAGAVPALADVLATGPKEAKFEALAIVGRRFDPALTHVIRAAIQDADPSVRVLASTVLAKLQTRFTRDLIALEEAAARSPDDAAAWIALARARRTYAESGLTEPLQARAEREAARLAAGRAVAAEPRNAAAQILLAEIDGADGRPADAPRPETGS
ncbi:hypothetical protein MKK54_14095 [Methylobacterium sp. J-068]|nr:hypothetical protein [Methylobacterium sp. J-068]